MDAGTVSDRPSRELRGRFAMGIAEGYQCRLAPTQEEFGTPRGYSLVMQSDRLRVSQMLRFVLSHGSGWMRFHEVQRLRSGAREDRELEARMDEGTSRVRRLLRGSPFWLQVLVLLAAGAVAVYAVEGGWPIRYGDEAQYLQIGEDWVHGLGYMAGGRPTAYRPPVWPVFLGFASLMLGHSRYLLLVPVALMFVSAVIAAVIVRRLTGSKWSAVGALMLLAYPLNAYTSSTLYPQAFATATLMAALLVITLSERGTGEFVLSQRLAVILGLLCAAMTLSVPTMAFTSLVLLGTALLRNRKNGFRASVLALLAAGVPILAWGIRNLLRLGAFVPLSTTSGENLLIGNNPTATGWSGYVNPERLAANIPWQEVPRDTYLREVAVGWILGHPGDAIQLWFAKTLNYFNPYTPPSTSSEAIGFALPLSWIAACAVLLLLLARFRFRSQLPIANVERLIVALFVLNAPVMALFFTRMRFRQPLDSSLLLVAAVPVVLFLDCLDAWIARRRRGRDRAIEAERSGL